MRSAIIVEDEALAAERLKILLTENQVAVLQMFRVAETALQWLSNHEVDIVFADIGLPEMNGLEFIKQMRRVARGRPAVIFTTASEDHALKAFELAATDYLLKPIRMVRLQEALARLPVLTETEGLGEFNVYSQERMIRLPWQKARYLVADEKNVILVDEKNQSYFLNKPLIYWEQLLGDKVIRIHRNALVFRHVFDGLVKIPGSNGEPTQWEAKIIDCPHTLPVSRRQLANIRRIFSLNEAD